MQHIKFQAMPVAPTFQTVKVTILEQTHRGSAFGNYGSFTYGGFTLKSVDEPALGWSSSECFVRGIRTYNDGKTIEMPVATYAKFKAAVEAFNRTFVAKPVAKPKADPCSVVIG